MRSSRRPSWATAMLAFVLFLTLSLLVHLRALTLFDEMIMSLATAYRPEWLVEPANWLYRLGFVQLNVALAAIWAVALLFRRRPIRIAVVPLLLIGATVIQLGSRLVVDQPSPLARYEIQRSFATQPIARSFDQADAVLRQAVLSAAVSTTSAADLSDEQPSNGEMRSFPSGHAARIAYLALLAIAATRTSIRSGTPSVAIVGVLAAIAFLVGYSTLFFGYHWPSDVIGGYLLALATFGFARQLGYT